MSPESILGASAPAYKPDKSWAGHRKVTGMLQLQIRLAAPFEVSLALLKTSTNFPGAATIPIIPGSAVHSPPFSIPITLLPSLKWAQARAMTF